VLCVGSIAPFFITAPSEFLQNMLRALTFHDFFYGLNIWTMLHHFGSGIHPTSPLVGIIAFIAVAGVFVLMLRQPIRTLGDAMLRALAVVATAPPCAR